MEEIYKWYDVVHTCGHKTAFSFNKKDDLVETYREFKQRQAEACWSCMQKELDEATLRKHDDA